MKKILFIKMSILALLVCWGQSAFAQVVLSDDFNSGLSPSWRTGARVSWQASGGMDNSPFVKINYLSSGTSPHAFSRSIPGGHQELYFKFNFKVVGFPSGGAKFLKVRALKDDSSNYANTTWMINYNTGRLKEISFGDGSSMLNDTQRTIRYNGTLSSSTTEPINIVHATDEVTIPLNQWHTFEAHMRYNSNGKRDGVYRVWYNGKLIVHATNVKNRHDNNPLHFNWLYLGNYSHSTWSAPWELHYDNVVISTQRMTSDGVPAPAPEAPPLISQPPASEEPAPAPVQPEPPAAPPSPPQGLRVIR
jgi:hypothetical protein